MPNSIIINPYAFGTGAPTNSLSFTSASSQYLTMSNANFGSYSASKFAIAGSIYLDTTGTKYLMDTYDGVGREFDLYIQNGTDFLFRPWSSSSPDGQLRINSSITTAGWYAFLVHYDGGNATSGDRIRVWINNNEPTPTTYTAPTGGSVDANTGDYTIGRSGTGSDYHDGLIYSLAFFDDVLPDPSDIFDGSAGKLKGFSSISGVHSILDASTATNDAILATDWTNNNTVTTTTNVP